MESGGEDPFDIEDDEDDGESDPLSDINHVKHLREMADLLNKVADALTVPDPGVRTAASANGNDAAKHGLSDVDAYSTISFAVQAEDGPLAEHLL